jgi:glycosyltransferase involved in cell wall biosynthesis
MTASLMLFRGGRRELAEEVARGEAPDEFLYGLPQLDRRLGGVTIVEPSPDRTLIDRLLRPLEMVTTRLGFGLFFSSCANRFPMFQRARTVIATTDSTAIPPLLLKRWGLSRARMVLISQGLHSFEASNPVRRWIEKQLGRCLHAASGIVVLGDGDCAALRTRFAHAGLPPVETIQFGIDERFWSPGEEASAPGERYFLSVGSDVLRDYDTLLRATGDLPLRLVTRMALREELRGPQVTVESKLTWPELRARYRAAAFVVTPVKDQPRDSGHSATLQAMACGKAVILSDTCGLWDRENLRHGETCWLVAPGDPEAMRAAIRHLWEHPEEATRIGANARELVVRKYSSTQFGEHMASFIESLP